MSVKSLLGAAVVILSLVGPSSALDPYCLHFSDEEWVPCVAWYGPPEPTTPCLETPCILGTCFHLWDSTPIMASYNNQFPEASEPQPGQSKRAAQLNSFFCYRSHYCEGCWFNAAEGGDFCGSDIFNPDNTFFFSAWYYEDIGNCPPVIVTIQDPNDKVS